MNWRIFLVLIMFGAGMFWVPFFVFAQTAATSPEIQALNKEIEMRKDKIKQLEETITQYKKNIDIKQTEGASLKNQIAILDNRAAELQAAIDQTNERVRQAELEISALTISIKEKNAVITQQKKILTTLVQHMNATEEKNSLEVLLSYENLGDFFTALKELENVYTDIGRSAQALRLNKEELESKRDTVTERRKTYQLLRQNLNNKKQDLNENIGLKQNLLWQTKESETRYRALLSSLRQQYQVIESEQRSYEEQLRRKLAERNQLPPGTDVSLDWPVPSRVITARFHDPDYPFRRVFEHSGLDIRAGQGTPVYAAAAGYVARARRCANSSCYSYVLIVHTGNISTVYGHLSAVNVEGDAFVNRGDILGYSGGRPGSVGAGPFVTGPHLHFEVRLNGLPTDPLPYLLP